jgi:hypothetical protein
MISDSVLFPDSNWWKEIACLVTQPAELAVLIILVLSPLQARLSISAPRIFCCLGASIIKISNY